jgi:dTDP-4-amino-4,6-dideoxygalactose transaminase
VLAPGFNYVLTDIAAAIGLKQLERLPELQARRARLAAEYDRLLAGLPEVSRPVVRDGVVHSRHLYAIRLEVERLRIDRAEVIEELRRRGIGTSVHYIPIHLHPFFQQALGLREGAFPVVERVFSGLLSLPLHPRMTDADVARVSRALHEIVEGARA